MSIKLPSNKDGLARPTYPIEPQSQAFKLAERVVAINLGITVEELRARQAGEGQQPIARAARPAAPKAAKQAKPGSHSTAGPDYLQRIKRKRRGPTGAGASGSGQEDNP